MVFGDKKTEAVEKAPKPVSDSKDTVRVSEQLLIVKAASTKEQLDVIVAADKRPGVQIAVKNRRAELTHIMEIAKILAAGGDPRVKGPEGLEAHDEARMAAREHPPAGKSGKSCAKCSNRITLARTYSTVDCEHIRPGQRITVGTPTAEDCGAYEEAEA